MQTLYCFGIDNRKAHSYLDTYWHRNREHPMINLPEILRDMEHWANGFLTGAAAASLIAIAGATIVVLARAV